MDLSKLGMKKLNGFTNGSDFNIRTDLKITTGQKENRPWKMNERIHQNVTVEINYALFIYDTYYSFSLKFLKE